MRDREGPRPLLDCLQLFSRLETNSFAWWNGNFSAGARIATDASLARAHVEYTKAPQFNAIAVGKRTLHAFENGFDGHFSFSFGDAGAIDNFVDDVELDHGSLVAQEFWVILK